MNESINISLNLSGAQKTIDSIKNLNININQTNKEVNELNSNAKSFGVTIYDLSARIRSATSQVSSFASNAIKIGTVFVAVSESISPMNLALLETQRVLGVSTSGLSRLISRQSELTKSTIALAQAASILGVNFYQIGSSIRAASLLVGVFSDLMSKFDNKIIQSVSKRLEQLSLILYSVYQNFAKLIGIDQSPISEQKNELVKLNSVYSDTRSNAQKLTDVFLDIGSVSAIAATAFDKISRNFSIFAKNATDSSKVVGAISKNFSLFDKGIVGSLLGIKTLGIALTATGTILNETDGKISQTTGKLLIFAGILSGSLAVAVTYLGKTIAELAISAGKYFTDIAKSATNTFLTFEKRFFVFERTVVNFNKVFGTSIGTLETYSKLIDELSVKTGTSVEALQAAATELVSVGAQYGFNRKQLEFLLRASTDYAEVAKTDVFQATLDLISGLNGQSQSVLKYGIKLTEATVAQKLLSKGIDIDKLTEQQKVQERYNILVSQYIPIAGLAADVTNTLAGQQKVLDATIKNASASFGKGAAIIENNGFVAFALNSILRNVSSTFYEITGFITAFSGRALSAIGTITILSFKFGLLYKIIVLLNDLLKTDLAQSAFAKSIPFINKSITELIQSTGVAVVDLKSAQGVAKTIFSAFVGNIKQFASLLSGVAASSITFTSFLSGTFKTAFTVATTAVRSLASALFALAINPLFIKITLIIASLYGLYRVFSEIESRTKIFSNSFNALLSIFNIFNPVIESTKNIFSSFFDFVSKKISNFVDKTLGLLVYSITKTIEIVTLLASKFPLISSAIGGEIPASVKQSVDKIKELNKELESSGFILSKVKKAADDLGDSFKKEFDFKALEKLREELKKTDELTLEGLKKQRIERITLISSGYQQELIKKKDFEQLKLSIEKDFLTKSDELFKKQQEQRRRLIQLGAERPIESLFSKNKDIRAGALGAIGKSITQGAAGAASLLGSTVQSLGNKIAPGIGEIAGPIVQELAKGKDAARAFVTKFLNAIPDMVVGLTEGVISAMDTMAEKAPEVIDRLVKNAPRIISAIIEGLPRVFLEMQNLMPSVAVTFATSLVSEAPRIAEAIARSIGNAPGNAVKGIGRAFKFAEGGQGFVKSVPAGFGSGSTERFPAVLGSGELVVDRSTATKLKQFLEFQSNGSINDNGKSEKTNMNLIEALINRPIIVNIDGREVARATRSQVRSGFVLA